MKPAPSLVKRFSTDIYLQHDGKAVGVGCHHRYAMHVDDLRRELPAIARMFAPQQTVLFISRARPHP